MNINIISLPERADRRDALYPNLQAMGVSNYNLFCAINGRVRYPNLKPPKMQGHFGCYDSHVALLDQLQRSPNQWECVLEDDAEIIAPITQPIDCCQSMHYLGGNITTMPDAVTVTDDIYDIANNVLCTHAYIVRVADIPAILKVLRLSKWKIDICMMEVQYQFKVTIEKTAKVVQRESRSDITGAIQTGAVTRW
jgi:hypothetical protein